MQIIPAIDIRGGRCVRLCQGDFAAETVFGDDPREMAERWFGEGAEQLHLVDLDGARLGRPGNLDSIERIIDGVSIPCQIGGGIRNRETIQQYLDAGLDRVILGTAALGDPIWLSEMASTFPGKICLGLDARNGRLASQGWMESSDLRAGDFAKKVRTLPLAAIIYTDIARDGMMGGVNVDATLEIRDAVPIPVIASGGISNLDDIRTVKEAGIAGCIVGRALYEGTVELRKAIELARK